MVSIIVPVYNCKLFVSRCLESLINQTYLDLEIIVIENGSSDGTQYICDKFAEKDNRIKVLHYEKFGAAKARNIGLSLANGKYVTFVDSDDYVETNYVEHLVNSIVKEDVELSVCNYNTVLIGSNGEILSRKPYDLMGGVKSSGEMLAIPVDDIDRQSICSFYETHYVWGRLFVLDIIRKNNIKFCEDLFIREDMVFMYSYSAVIKSLYVSDIAYYNYHVYHTKLHVSLGKQRNPNYFENSNATYNEICNIIQKNNVSDNYKNLLKRAYCSWIIGCIVRAAKDRLLSRKETVEKIKKYCDVEVFRYGLVLYKPSKGRSKLIPWVLYLKLWTVTYYVAIVRTKYIK
jgi:glycosyltransferase involved in cell wall biosynthesis